MKRNLLRMMLMVFGVFACARSVAIAGEAQSAETVFKKSLSDGRVALVKKTTSKERKQPTEADQQALPKSFIAVGGEIQTDLYTLLLCDGDREVVVWEKKIVFPVIPQHGFSDNLTIHDVATNRGRAAILFSHRGAKVEIVEKKGDNGFAVVNSQTLFPNEIEGIVRVGELAWLDGLYVVMKTAIEESIWRIGEKSATRLWSSRQR